jgi:hypothetical protein
MYDILLLRYVQATMDRAVWITENDHVNEPTTALGASVQEHFLEAEIVAVEPLRPLIVPEDFRD